MIVYMNELVRDKENAKSKSRQPVISVVSGNRLIYVNEVTLRDDFGGRIARVVYDPKNNPSAFHHVSAWVEIDDQKVSVDFK